MSIYWHSTLIPVRPRFKASPDQIAAFLHRCEEGAFGATVERKFWNFDGASRQVQRPATSADIMRLGRGLRHWRAQCEAERQGRNAPVDEMTTGFLAIACENHGQVVSMCDLHEESNDRRKVEFFGEPCSVKQRRGLFSHPHSLRVLSVPNAGCASFHIEFWFGNLILPPTSMRKRNLVRLHYQATARSSFGLDFVEGCHWG